MDLTGLAYPQPVMKTQALLEEGRGGPLTIGLDEAMSASAVAALLTAAGLKAQTYRQGDHWLGLGREWRAPEILVWHGPGGWQAALDDQADTEEGDEEPILDLGPPLSPVSPGPGPTPPTPPALEPEPGRAVVMVGSRHMGVGEDALWDKLATAFFDTLAALDPPPRLIAFYNTGVFLTTRESALVEALRDLAGRGATVISCGLCLEYFNLRDQLKVGRIGNMYEIVKAQTQAARVVRF